MILITIPSLLHMASVKIASYLMQDSDIGELLQRERNLPIKYNCFDRDTHELWLILEAIAVEKLPGLPPHLPNKVAKLIRQMYYEFHSWVMDNDLPKENENFVTYLNSLCWKTDGTIDGTQTAKKCIQSRNIDYRDRFVIACNYNLKDEILSLWNRKKWWFKLFGVDSITGRRTNVAVRLWIHILKMGKTELVNEIVEQYFRFQNFNTSEIPLRLTCYFSYLSDILRWEILCHCLLHKQDFRLCLYQMDEIERMEFLQSHPRKILSKCLQWPYEALLLKMAKEITTQLTESDFRYILDYIIVFYILRGYDYFELFKEFWMSIPVIHQEEMKTKKEFKTYQVVLNYCKESQSQSFLETVATFFPFMNFYVISIGNDNLILFR